MDFQNFARNPVLVNERSKPLAIGLRHWPQSWRRAIQHNLTSIRRRVGRDGYGLGQLVRRWWGSRGRRGRGNSGGLASDAPALLQHLAFDGTQPAYFAAHRDLGVTIRLQHRLG